jgi:hypothetical protein
MVLLLPIGLWGQNCPIGKQTIPFNDSTTFNLDVFGVVNNSLANPKQGVCGVKLNFLHHPWQFLERRVCTLQNNCQP